MRSILTFLALLAAHPALALSCMPPDAVRLLEMARSQDADFYIIKGQVTLREAANLPLPGSKTPTFTKARVTGIGLSQNGFDVPVSYDVVIEASCAGRWCGEPDKLKGEMILAVEVADGNLTLQASVCGGDYVRWTQNEEDRLLSCHKDGLCQPAEF